MKMRSTVLRKDGQHCRKESQIMAQSKISLQAHVITALNLCTVSFVESVKHPSKTH